MEMEKCYRFLVCDSPSRRNWQGWACNSNYSDEDRMKMCCVFVINSKKEGKLEKNDKRISAEELITKGFVLVREI